jgi:multicomponent Na+:H+ antiporter subunit G
VTLAALSDALVVLGLVVMTVGVYGLYRMPDVYTQLHASSKAVFLGVIALLAASIATRDGAVVARAGLTAVFLTLTTPVAGHVVARAAYRARQRLETPGAVDESDSGIVRGSRARADLEDGGAG